MFHVMTKQVKMVDDIAMFQERIAVIGEEDVWLMS